jgi:hypothetical protein
MTTLYLSGLAFAVIALLIWALRRDATARGKAETQAETYEHVIENIKEANAVRDRLKSDPAYADSVRDRFTRK